MLIEFYAAFMVISFVFLALGYTLHNEIFKIVGYSIMAVMNISVLFGDGFGFKTGEILTQTTNETTINAYTYSHEKPHVPVFLLSIIGILGASLFVWLEYRTTKGVNE